MSIMDLEFNFIYIGLQLQSVAELATHCCYHRPMTASPDRLFTQRTQAVQRALQVLDLFSLASPQLSLQEISTQLGMAPSTTHRLLKTLEESAWLARIEGTELYRL